MPSSEAWSRPDEMIHRAALAGLLICRPFTFPPAALASGAGGGARHKLRLEARDRGRAGETR